MDVRRLDSTISLLHQEYNSAHTYENRLFVPSPDRVNGMIARARALLAEVGPVPESGKEGVIKAIFTEVLESLLGRLADDQGYPFRYINEVTEDLNPFIEVNPRPAVERAEVLIQRLSQYPALFEGAVAMTGRTAEDRRVMTVETLQNVAGMLPRMRTRSADLWNGQVAASTLAHLENAFQQAEAACARAQQSVSQLPVAAQPVMGLTYKDLLAQVFGASAEELAARTREDVASLQREMDRLAREINPTKTADQILKEDITPYESPEKMLEAMREMSTKTRELCASLLDLPAGEECRVELVPPHLNDLFPWGGYSGPDTLSGHLVGTCYINGSNYQNISRGWLMNMALHEAYPGHHTQYVCTSAGKIPQSAKMTQLYSRGSHAVEGMAHRSEKKFQDIYGDPTFPLFVVYRQLHTAVRILCELEINYYGNGIPAALELYRQYMGFPPEVAKGQARLQTMWRGYMTSYFTGHRKFDVIQKETGLENAEFTRLLFTHGFLSVETLGRIARLTREERDHLFDEFI